MPTICDLCPVSINAYYRSYAGRLLISAAGRKFKEELGRRLEGCEKVTGPVEVSVSLCFPDKRKRDVDNYLKPLLDVAKNRLFEDDDQIYRLAVQKKIGAGGGYKIEIEVTPYVVSA